MGVEHFSYLQGGGLLTAGLTAYVAVSVQHNIVVLMHKPGRRQFIYHFGTGADDKHLATVAAVEIVVMVPCHRFVIGRLAGNGHWNDDALLGHAAHGTVHRCNTDGREPFLGGLQNFIGIQGPVRAFQYFAYQALLGRAACLFWGGVHKVSQ